MIREKVEKIEKMKKDTPTKEMWSCPLCCTYHEPLKMQTYSKMPETKRCDSCGWEGIVKDLPFKPVAVDLQYELTGIDRKDLVFKSYLRRGVENFPVDKANDMDIFEYLYRDNLHQVWNVVHFDTGDVLNFTSPFAW